MILGALQVELHIPESGSLKSKRKVLKSLKDRLRHKFNVSLCEVDFQDKWQRCLMGIVTVGTSRKFVNEVLDKVLNHIEMISEIQVLDSQIEID